jgi:hypothetical protein
MGIVISWITSLYVACGPSHHIVSALRGMFTHFIPEFKKIYRQFFPFGDPGQFADYVFNVRCGSTSVSNDGRDFS